MPDFPLYKTSRWQYLRRAQLQRVPYCERCRSRGQLRPATVCDHVTPHRGDPVAFWRGPFASLCERCHNSAKQSEESRGYSLEIGADGYPVDPRHPFNSGGSDGA